MKPVVGYLIKRQDGLYGERGQYFDYILSGAGVFIEAEGSFMAARIPVAQCDIRGLALIDAKVVLRHGPIPQHIFDLALSEMIKDISREKYVAVVWKEDAYHLEVPEQDATGGQVQYQNPDSVVLDLHSHGKMGAFFSTKDNADEQGLRLYGVVGKLDGTPVVLLRAGVYSYYHPIRWSQVFDGSLQSAVAGDEIEEEVGNDVEHWWQRIFR